MCYRTLCLHCNWDFVNFILTNRNIFCSREHCSHEHFLFRRTFFVPTNIVCSHENFLFPKTFFWHQEEQQLLGPLSRARGQKQLGGKLCDVRYISTVTGWNLPCITQPLTRLPLTNHFLLCTDWITCLSWKRLLVSWYPKNKNNNNK